GIAKHVVFHGTKTGAEKWRCFMTADVFCFPTTYPRENQPVAVIEAMMAGLPIVATQWRAIPDLIEHGREGLLTPVGDAPALAAALRSLASSPAMRSRVGKAARARFESMYRLEAHLQRVEDIARTTIEVGSEGWPE
ncbi:MAG: glycosyltransferase family 4 protein, partial [Gemmatimonadota bacterium]|nr:glycosyltransferase family 4 protein [Gemmatimonadota bacterium]